MKLLTEPKSSVLTISCQPDGGVSEENPPRFTWVPESEQDLRYKLQISADVGFGEGQTKTWVNLPYNFFTPDEILQPGLYYWRYSLDEPDGQWAYSRERTFIIEEEAIADPLPSREVRYAHVSYTHPRIWLNQDNINDFRRELKQDEYFCNFSGFMANSVKAYAGQEFVKEPLPYPDNKRVIRLWRKNYTDCQEALCYIRSLAVGGMLTEDRAMTVKAKDALLQLASWDPKGPTARAYNDECGFRTAYALAFGYDWLYDELSEKERQQVREVLFARTREVADHIMIHTRIHYSLYDSHAVRSLSSVIVPCCIALLGEYEEAEKWLNYAIEYFCTIYTPWGGADGGWAEGPAYWTTGMAFVTEALSTIKSFTGINLYKRPFFQKTGDFPLYCNPVDTYRASFCDQSDLGQYPGHKLAYNIRQFAGETGNQDYQWYYEKVFEREPQISQEFYNKGWWDFYYDDVVYQYEHRDVRLQQLKEPSRLKWFRDIGWAAVNDHMKEFDQHLFLLTKSSPYGSVSHSQGDQNTFVLFAYGEPFIITSGYYIGFNSSMHRDWRRQTKAHNTILIHGMGQYAGMDKVKQLGAKGRICKAEESDGVIYIKEDATESYRINVPDMIQYTREIYYTDQGYVVLADTVETDEPGCLDWLLHSLSPFEIQEDSFSVTREKGRLEGRIVYCSSGIDGISQTDIFEGTDPGETDGLEKQWHLDMKTRKARKHVIIALLIPEKAYEKKLVSTIKDDQGMDIYYYFESDGHILTVKVDGNMRH